MAESFLTAIGLVLVLEGVLWALAPSVGKDLARQALDLDERTLRLAGTTAVALGVFVVWLVRG